MLIPKLTDGGPPLTVRDIEAVEEKLGARLPAPYRRFLFQQNGGYVELEYTAIKYFYMVKSRRKFDDLLHARRRMQEWLPDELIPIASDSFDNEICLAIKGKNRGKVYFWNFEGAPERVDIRAKYPELFADLDEDDEDDEEDEIITWPGEPDLTLIADSFPEFLEDMHERAKELEAEIAEAEAKEARAKAKAARAKATSTRAKAKPTRAKAKPTRGKAKSTRAKAGSRPAKARPASDRAKPATPAPSKGKAKPGKSKAARSRPAKPRRAGKGK